MSKKRFKNYKKAKSQAASLKVETTKIFKYLDSEPLCFDKHFMEFYDDFQRYFLENMEKTIKEGKNAAILFVNHGKTVNYPVIVKASVFKEIANGTAKGFIELIKLAKQVYPHVKDIYDECAA